LAPRSTAAQKVADAHDTASRPDEDRAVGAPQAIGPGGEGAVVVLVVLPFVVEVAVDLAGEAVPEAHPAQAQALRTATTNRAADRCEAIGTR
jgi:hypothetical protein